MVVSQAHCMYWMIVFILILMLNFIVLQIETHIFQKKLQPHMNFVALDETHSHGNQSFLQQI